LVGYFIRCSMVRAVAPQVVPSELLGFIAFSTLIGSD